MKVNLFLAARAAAGIAAGAMALVAGLGGAAQAAYVTHATHAAPAAAMAAQPTLNVQSCIGNSFCLATGTKPGHGFIPLIEVWNGKTWRIIPNPSGYEGQITCGGPAFCLAVVPTKSGHARFKDVQWNGRAWRQFKPQPPVPAVDCLSPKFCTELISDGQLPDREVFWTGGTTWQTMPASDDGCGGAWCDITEFGCGSATICWDAGNYCGDSGCDNGIFNYTDVWNGKTWADTTNSTGPVVGGDQACAGRSFCMTLDPPQRLASVTNDWGQTWQSASKNLATACGHLVSCAFPANLSCGSAHFCLALPSTDPTGALVWNGVKWGFAKLAQLGGHLPKLNALSCGSARNCVATGTYQRTPRSAPRSVVEHWNGKAWAITPIAKP